MESRLTIGLRNTFTRVAPIEAKSPISAGPRTDPFANTFSPERMSFPIGLKNHRQKFRLTDLALFPISMYNVG